jgi:hypothetical protein
MRLCKFWSRCSHFHFSLFCFLPRSPSLTTTPLSAHDLPSHLRHPSLKESLFRRCDVFTSPSAPRPVRFNLVQNLHEHGSRQLPSLSEASLPARVVNTQNFSKTWAFTTPSSLLSISRPLWPVSETPYPRSPAKYINGAVCTSNGGRANAIVFYRAHAGYSFIQDPASNANTASTKNNG